MGDLVLSATVNVVLFGQFLFGILEQLAVDNQPIHVWEVHQ